MTKNTSKPKGREAIKAWNHMKIIDATVDIVSQYGIAGTTIGRVVERAEVSRGLVNVQFNSKDMLIFEAAKYMYEHYRQIRKPALKRAMNCPVKQLEALIHTDFSRSALNQRSAGFWLAIRSQVRSSPEYIPLAETRDPKFRQALLEPIKKINKEGNYNLQISPIVYGLMALLEGMWMDYYIHPKNFDRQKAISTSFLYLSAFFPQHFGKPEESMEESTQQIT